MGIKQNHVGVSWGILWQMATVCVVSSTEYDTAWLWAVCGVLSRSEFEDMKQLLDPPDGLLCNGTHFFEMLVQCFLIVGVLFGAVLAGILLNMLFLLSLIVPALLCVGLVLYISEVNNCKHSRQQFLLDHLNAQLGEGAQVLLNADDEPRRCGSMGIDDVLIEVAPWRCENRQLIDHKMWCLLHGGRIV